MSLFIEDVHNKRCCDWLTRNTTKEQVYDLTADQREAEETSSAEEVLVTVLNAMH